MIERGSKCAKRRLILPAVAPGSAVLVWQLNRGRQRQRSSCAERDAT